MSKRNDNLKGPTANKSSLVRLFTDFLRMFQEPAAAKLAEAILDPMTDDELISLNYYFQHCSKLGFLQFTKAAIRLNRESKHVRIPNADYFIVKDSRNDIQKINYFAFWKTFSELNHVPPPSSHAQEPEAHLRAVLNDIKEFRTQTIRTLQDALNSFLGAIAESQMAEPSKKKSEDLLPYEDKQALVNLVNAGLNSIGAAIRHDGQDCYLGCTTGTAAGRFMIVPKGAKTAVLSRVNLGDFLPLELVDTIPSGPEIDRWTSRVRNKGVRAKE